MNFDRNAPNKALHLTAYSLRFGFRQQVSAGVRGECRPSVSRMGVGANGRGSPTLASAGAGRSAPPPGLGWWGLQASRRRTAFPPNPRLQATPGSAGGWWQVGVVRLPGAPEAQRSGSAQATPWSPPGGLRGGGVLRESRGHSREVGGYRSVIRACSESPSGGRTAPNQALEPTAPRGVFE
jgi:hypothetical protein